MWSFFNINVLTIDRKIFPPVIFSIIFLFLISALIWLFIAFEDSNLFPIKEVYIEGDLNYLDQKKLKKDIARFTNKGFFQTEILKISKNLQEDHWVSEVSVKKIWPSSVLVKIKERVPKAKLNGNFFFDEQGVIFEPKFVPNIDILKIQDFSGNPQNTFNISQKLNSDLQRKGLILDNIEKSKLGIIRFKLSDAKEVVLGNENDFERNVRRFLKCYEIFLNTSWHEIEKIDLRYSDGFAVRFNEN